MQDHETTEQTYSEEPSSVKEQMEMNFSFSKCTRKPFNSSQNYLSKLNVLINTELCTSTAPTIL